MNFCSKLMIRGVSGVISHPFSKTSPSTGTVIVIVSFWNSTSKPRWSSEARPAYSFSTACNITVKCNDNTLNTLQNHCAPLGILTSSTWPQSPPANRSIPSSPSRDCCSSIDVRTSYIQFQRMRTGTLACYHRNFVVRMFLAWALWIGREVLPASTWQQWSKGLKTGRNREQRCNVWCQVWQTWGTSESRITSTHN